MTSARPERVAAVIGDPARHSRSPAIHNAAFAATGLDWVFTAFEVPAGGGEAALEAMRVLQLAGLSVTMPLKSEVAEASDTRDYEVEVLGAANCIVPLDDGRLRAVNTDGLRIRVRPPGRRRSRPGRPPGGPAGRGRGGPGGAGAWGLAAAGAADVAVINRTPSKAQAAADVANAAREAGQPGRVGSMDDIAAADIVVNATSVGMGAGAASVPLRSGVAAARPGRGGPGVRAAGDGLAGRPEEPGRRGSQRPVDAGIPGRGPPSSCGRARRRPSK